MKYFLLSLLFLVPTGIFAQKVSDYSFVIVPEKYDTMKKVDQYQVNALTVFLLKKYGFNAYLESDQMPFVLADIACDVLYADLQDNSNFIQTRLHFILKDCDGEVIYKTTQARSKKKDFKAAYQEALREAFQEIKDLGYSTEGIQVDEQDKPMSDTSVNTDNVNSNENSKELEPPVALDPEAEELLKMRREVDEIVNQTKELLRQRTSQKEPTTPVVFMSEDGFYKAIRLDDIVTFYEGNDSIGSSTILREEGFLVSTSQFEGEAFFKEGRLIINRRIKGVAGLVQMIFTKE